MSELSPVPQADSFVATWTRSSFRPWQASNDPLAAGDDVGAAKANVMEQLQADAFAEGLRQGEAIASNAAAAAATEAAARIALAADRFEPCSDNALAALLAETVATLMREMFDADISNPDQLERRARRLAQMICDDVDPTCVRLHPDDASMFLDRPLPWPIADDHTLDRGEIRLETKEGGMSDNPGDRIERLRRRIAGEANR